MENSTSSKLSLKTIEKKNIRSHPKRISEIERMIMLNHKCKCSENCEEKCEAGKIEPADTGDKTYSLPPAEYYKMKHLIEYETYSERRKKRFPEMPLSRLNNQVSQYLRRKSHQSINSNEEIKPWRAFKVEHRSPNVVPESPSLAFAEDKENPKFSNLSLEPVETKNIPPDASNSEVTKVLLNHTYKPAESCETKCEAGIIDPADNKDEPCLLPSASLYKKKTLSERAEELALSSMALECQREMITQNLLDAQESLRNNTINFSMRR
ncbi:uncharacterized protein LOC122856699 isoform X2 [Aphidius gifuensis]|nr:uncharacterized protein LOC122856699 isoform X2 [Aphidius gifuensis]